MTWQGQGVAWLVVLLPLWGPLRRPAWLCLDPSLWCLPRCQGSNQRVTPVLAAVHGVLTTDKTAFPA